MGSQAHYRVRAEGVNFSATLDDTEDLSTIRGAGLALSALGVAVRAGLAKAGASDIKPVFSGASQAEFLFVAPLGHAETARQSVLDELRRTGPNGEPFQHLSFVVDVVEVADGADAATSAIAEARNRSRQFRQWTVLLPEFVMGARQFDKLDRMRPARTRSGWGEDLVSDSTAARHEFGRQMRQNFYVRALEADADRRRRTGPATETDLEFLKQLAFVDHFKDMVMPPPEGLPLSPRSAMAVIYADGNSFGTIRSQIGVERFSEELDVLRADLLRRILRWYQEGLQGPRGRFALPAPGPKPPLRLETLMWGGDELMFVVPSWLAFPFAEGFFAVTRKWRIEKQPLTHTVGVVICHYKTPIREARALAKVIAEKIKDKMRDAKAEARNAVGIEVFESLAPPDDDLLDAHRARSYGIPIVDASGLALELAFPGDEFAAVSARITELSSGEPAPLPHSQLYRILRSVKATAPNLASHEASKAARAQFEDYERWVRKVGQFTTGGLRLPCLTPLVGARSLAIELALLAQLSDYADPFADNRLPRFP